MSGRDRVYGSDEIRKVPSKTDWDRGRREEQAGIEPDMSDPDDAGATDAAFAQAMAKRRGGQRGPQVAPTKRAVSIRLSPDVLDFFKATGKGWQTRIDEALRKVAGL